MEKIFETKRLILKTLHVSECADALAYYSANKEFLKPFEPNREASFYTLDNQRHLLKNDWAEMTEQKMLRLWIYLKEGDGLNRPIGNLAFSNIVRGVFLNCFLGYKLDEQYVNQGYMTEALEKGIEVMFDTYGLHRIEANIMPRNEASIALVKKLGFYNEGLAKAYLRINGVWEDHIHMVKLNNKL